MDGGMMGWSASLHHFLKAAQAHNSNAKDGMERWGITCQATNSKPKPKGFSCCCNLEDNIKIAWPWSFQPHVWFDDDIVHFCAMWMHPWHSRFGMAGQASLAATTWCLATGDLFLLDLYTLWCASRPWHHNSVCTDTLLCGYWFVLLFVLQQVHFQTPHKPKF